jgi:hypothetical protein
LNRLLIRKNVARITLKLRASLARDEERLEQLRNGWNDSRKLLDGAQMWTDESRTIFDQLRVNRRLSG